MTKNTIKLPAVADMFYPGDPAILTWEIHKYLNSAIIPDLPEPRAVISPHAGYLYSGPVAASAYKVIGQYPQAYDRVVLLGPSHRVGFKGVASSSYNFFRTALGDIPLDKTMQKELEKECPFVTPFDAAHSREHCIEVQLPFLQEVLAEFSIIPMVVGQTRPMDTARIMEYCLKLPRTLVVISSDLSHYHTYDEAGIADAKTAKIIENLDADRLEESSACGSIAVAGLLIAARKSHLTVERLELRNSGDMCGDKDRVVGYGAWVFMESANAK